MLWRYLRAPLLAGALATLLLFIEDRLLAPGSIGWLYICVICFVGFMAAELGVRKESKGAIGEEQEKWCELSAQQLMEMAKGKTSLAQEEVNKPYLGQLKRVIGKVLNVDDRYDSYTIFLEAQEDGFDYLTHVDMKKKHKQRLLTLGKGETITVKGKLKSFSASGLSLENGEFN